MMYTEQQEREAKAKILLMGYSEPIKSELKGIFEQSAWDMLTICNVYHSVSSIQYTKDILHTASSTAIDPMVIINAISK